MLIDERYKTISKDDRMNENKDVSLIPAKAKQTMLLISILKSKGNRKLHICDDDNAQI